MVQCHITVPLIVVGKIEFMHGKTFLFLAPRDVKKVVCVSNKIFCRFCEFYDQVCYLKNNFGDRLSSNMYIHRFRIQTFPVLYLFYTCFIPVVFLVVAR